MASLRSSVSARGRAHHDFIFPLLHEPLDRFKLNLGFVITRFDRFFHQTVCSSLFIERLVEPVHPLPDVLDRFVVILEFFPDPVWDVEIQCQRGEVCSGVPDRPQLVRQPQL